MWRIWGGGGVWVNACTPITFINNRLTSRNLDRNSAAHTACTRDAGQTLYEHRANVCDDGPCSSRHCVHIYISVSHLRGLFCVSEGNAGSELCVPQSASDSHLAFHFSLLGPYYSMLYAAVQSQKAVTGYSKRKQLLSSGFARPYLISLFCIFYPGEDPGESICKGFAPYLLHPHRTPSVDLSC